MKLPIPDDWSGEEWECVQIQWPKSPMYRYFLRGFLSYLTRGRVYDENTGSIKTAQAIGRQIYNRNREIQACYSEPVIPPVIPPDGHNSVCGGGGGLSFDEWEIATMGSFITNITFDKEGHLVLHFGECCFRLAEFENCVAGDEPPTIGDIAGNTNPPDIEDIDDEFEPPAGTDKYACLKATALVKAFEDMMFALNDAVDMVDIYAVPDYIKAQVPYLGLTTSDCIDAYLNYTAAERIIPISEVEWTTEQTELAICRLVEKLDNTSTAMTEEEFDEFYNAIDAAGDVLTGSIFKTLAKNTIKKSQYRNAIRLGIFATEADCSCPEVVVPPEDFNIPVPYTWLVVFDWRTSAYGFTPTDNNIGTWEEGVGITGYMTGNNGHGMRLVSTSSTAGPGLIAFIRHETEMTPLADGRLWEGQPLVIAGTGKWNISGVSLNDPPKSHLEMAFNLPLPAYNATDTWAWGFGQMQFVNGILNGHIRLIRTIIAGHGACPFPDQQIV